MGASTDTASNAHDLATGLRLGFVKVVYGVDADQANEQLGVNTAMMKDHPIMHAAGFLLDPEGKLVTSVISSGPNGRFVPGEMMQKVAFEVARRG